MKSLDEVKTLVGDLPSANLPLVLLPVQIQTRFISREGRDDLLVRVYPDDAHVDAHEEDLTAEEATWGQAYWKLIWGQRGDREAQRSAWAQIADRFGPPRAAWIARQLTPTNLDQQPTDGASGPDPVFPALNGPKPDAWTAPAMARALPDRWVVMGYRGGQRVLLETGTPIPEDLAVGLAPANAADLPAGAGEETLALDEGIRWLVDFAEAERVGMGIRVALPPELVGRTLDALYVFGLKNSLAPAASADLLESLLDSQHYTRGLSFVPPGAPTNNSAEATTGFGAPDPGFANSFQVERRPVNLPPDTNGARTAHALGIRRRVFSAVEGAASTQELDARHMQTALWPVTGGYYLEQILAEPEGASPAFSDRQIEQARRYFVDAVRPAGPLPALRFGRQPYGLLPVTSMDSLPSRTDFVRLLDFLRDGARQALPRLPRVQPGPRGDDDLVEVLRMQPYSTGVRARLAFDSQFFVPGSAIIPGTLSDDLKTHLTELSVRLRPLQGQGLIKSPRLLDLLPANASTALRADPIQKGASAGPLSPNYIAWLRTATFDEILDESFPPDFGPSGQMDALLYLLLRHAVLLAYTTTAYRIRVRRGELPKQPYREPTLVDILGKQTPQRTRTLPRVLLDPVRTPPTERPLRATIHLLGAADEPEAAVLEELRASLAHLETLPIEVLEPLLRGTLDLFAYRLDAWITSLASRRLDELRQARPRGVVLGGFGWVENLRPAPRDPVPNSLPNENVSPLFADRAGGGFIHAPSLSQASAAAILRSGYLSQPGEDDGGTAAISHPFAVDLSSQRVRLAQFLLEGIRQGQSLGALLGYRFERGLHDHGLDRFIAGFRKVSLLAAVYQAEDALSTAQKLPDGPIKDQAVKAATAALQKARQAVNRRHQFPTSADVETLENVVEANVTDGLALVRLWQEGQVPFNRLAPDLSAPRRLDLEAELEALEAVVDALSDALTAESVYQIVRGNAARAGATVDSVANGEIPPPELEMVQTTRSGVALTHRLLVLFSGPTPAAPSDPRQARRRAEPRLNGWLAQMLGGLNRVRCRAEFLDTEGNVIRTLNRVRLSTLPISHLDAVYLSSLAEGGALSDLEAMLQFQLLRTAPASLPPDARVRLLPERLPSFSANEISLGEFMEIAEAFRQLILSGRELRGSDLLPARQGQPVVFDLADLRARADVAVTSLKSAGPALAAQAAAVTALAEGAPLAGPLNELRERILALSFLGFQGAVPASARGDAPADRERLLEQAAILEREAIRREEELSSLEAGFDPATASPDQAIEHELARLQAVFGPGFRVLPRLVSGGFQELARAFNRSDDLQGGDPLEAVSWLQGVSRVRGGANRLDTVLAFAAALARPAAQELRVAQLPFQSGERWVALPPAAGESIPSGKLSLVAHLPKPFRPAQPLAGLFVDEWVEIVPGTEEVGGVAFNYDSPGARPPQAILIAVSPAGTQNWELETLEKTLLGTFELAQLRALDPQALGEDVLLQRALPALYVSLNLAGEALSTNFGRAIA